MRGGRRAAGQSSAVTSSCRKQPGRILHCTVRRALRQVPGLWLLASALVPLAAFAGPRTLHGKLPRAGTDVMLGTRGTERRGAAVARSLVARLGRVGKAMTLSALNSRPSACASVMIASIVSLAGCASRTVPESSPPSSAASDRAGEAPPAVVTASLDAEPPLDAEPGEEPAGHEHHGGGHHGP